MSLSKLKHQPKYKILKEDFDSIKARRAELLVELFLEELNPVYFAKVNSEKKRELPFDYLVFLQEESVLLAFGVLVKAYNEKSESLKSVQVSADEYAQLTGSTLPILIITVDVKEKHIFSNWASDLVGNTRASQHKLQLKEGKEHIYTLLARNMSKLV